MIHLRLRTEYCYRTAYGKVPAVIAAAGGAAAGIADNGGTWGHVQWAKECKKAGVRPILGVTLQTVARPEDKSRQPEGSVTLLARNDGGLCELYEMVSAANRAGFYYHPRVSAAQLDTLSEDVFLLLGPGSEFARYSKGPTRYAQLSPESAVWNRQARGSGWPTVLVGDNYYPRPSDRGAYEVLAADTRFSRAGGLMHVADEYELLAGIPGATPADVERASEIAALCHATIPKAEGVRPPRPDTLYNMCIAGAAARGMAVAATSVGDHVRYGVELGNERLGDDVYQERLVRELTLIREKGFEDYFYVISDMVRYAKDVMLVGPARGSSAGSLACFLLSITDVDPIVHDLMFERFIDVTRADLPDVDIDFQDDRRELVIEHLRRTYGASRVGRIGTVMRYKAKSTLTDVGRELNIPPWELNDVKDAVIERSTGDARAAFCIQDALETLEIGKALVAKYPQIKVAGELEAHARQSGMHAAGIIVCQEPITRYCAIDKSGAAQIDKKDAEVLNLLKIDALGLRTLSVLQDCLDQLGRTRDWLVTYPLDDREAFEVFNADRYAGIFQYEGYALQSLTRQMKIREFNDIVVITALARPGPLHCGAATEFIARRTGNAPVVHLHPTVAHLTAETYGTVIYQEQVMAIGRHMGRLSWEDVSELRKAMSKSLGEEFFNQYWVKFEAGAREQGIPSAEAKRVWDRMCTFGSWAFNKSHAVSYGLLSYWCAMLKARHPLQYAAACLRNAKDEEQSIKMLRELAKEGFSYVPVDPKRSGLTWDVVDGQLLGGLTNVNGIGPKTAEEIIARRKNGKPLAPGVAKKLIAPVTPYDDIFEGERRWGDMYTDPKKYAINSGALTYVRDIQEAGEYVFIAKLKEKNLRDLNEYGNVVKRGGRRVARHNLFLNLVVEDDTGSIIIKVGRYEYPKWGKPIVETGRVGDWYVWKGNIREDGWRMVMVTKWRRLGDAPAATAPLGADALQKVTHG